VNQTTASTVVAPSPADVEKDAKVTSDPAPQPGIAESAKIDYGEASRHGILAPPPAGASKIGKLWHQAKEYFVSSSKSIIQHPDTQRLSRNFMSGA
jgi:LETM1 and EF-hand domain-containing protein 1